MISNIIFRPVETLEDALEMRKIRNECKDFMTRNTDYISEEQQEVWFMNLDHKHIKMFLVYETFHGVDFSVVGYGYYKEDDYGVYLTGGLTESVRGKGYGRALFEHLIKEVKNLGPRRILLEVLNTNERAQNLYASLGFKPIYMNEKITEMELDE